MSSQLKREMEKPSFTIFHLTEERAIAILATPPDQLEDPADRYIAASQLVNFPTEPSIRALMGAIGNKTPGLDNRIVRRKAVETLGYLKAVEALPAIKVCLQDEDRYTVDNAVWAIGEMGCQDEAILAEIAQLLEKPRQNYRATIQTLVKLNYLPALEQIRSLTTSEDPTISGAAIAAICRLSQDYTDIVQVVELLQHSTANARRSAIQDLVDARYYPAIPQIAKSPVSVTFRLRGLRLLAEAGIPAGKIAFQDVEPYLDRVIRDSPADLEFVHEYDREPALEFLINELYETDFGRCYLATQTLLTRYAQEAPAALMAAYAERARGDYGAHYHVIKLLGWLQYQPAYEILVEALKNPAPQFKKSRTAAAIALGELADGRAIPELQAHFHSGTWELQYACLIALSRLVGKTLGVDLPADADLIVSHKIRSLS